MTKSETQTKPITEVHRYVEPSGTYEVTLVEQSRRKLTTKDELIPILASLASEAQEAVHNNLHLLIGEKDVYLAFARRFLSYLEKEPKLFTDFLADTKVNDIAAQDQQASTKPVKSATSKSKEQ